MARRGSSRSIMDGKSKPPRLSSHTATSAKQVAAQRGRKGASLVNMACTQRQGDGGSTAPRWRPARLSRTWAQVRLEMAREPGLKQVAALVGLAVLGDRGEGQSSEPSRDG
jgi:hypothetical protein